MVWYHTTSLYCTVDYVPIIVLVQAAAAAAVPLLPYHTYLPTYEYLPTSTYLPVPAVPADNIMIVW